MKKYLVGNRLVKASDIVKVTKSQPKKEETKVEEIINDSELDELTVKELKKKAKELGLKDLKGMKKGELIDLIESTLDESEEL